MPGRAPANTIAKVVAMGNPLKKAIPVHDWQPAQKKIKPPNFLNWEAKKIWNRIVPSLVANRRIGEEEWMGIAALCTLWARFESCNLEFDVLVRNGGLEALTFEARGNLKPHPLLQIARGDLNQILRILGEYGLTPSTRNRTLQTVSPQTDDMFGY